MTRAVLSLRAAAGPDAVFGSDVFAPSIALLGGHQYSAWESSVDFITGGSTTSKVVGWARGVTSLAGEWAPALCDAVDGLEEAEALALIYRLFGYDDLALPQLCPHAGGNGRPWERSGGGCIRPRVSYRFGARSAGPSAAPL